MHIAWYYTFILPMNILFSYVKLDYSVRKYNVIKCVIYVRTHAKLFFTFPTHNEDTERDTFG